MKSLKEQLDAALLELAAIKFPKGTVAKFDSAPRVPHLSNGVFTVTDVNHDGSCQVVGGDHACFYVDGEWATVVGHTADYVDPMHDREIVAHLFEIDWMGAEQFCDHAGIPVPYFKTGKSHKELAQQFIFVDCMRWKTAIEFAKTVKRRNEQTALPA